MFGSPLMSKRKHFTNKHPSPTRLAVAVLSRLPLGVPAGIMLIAVVIFMAYLPSINGGFVLDDGLLLTENKIINASDGLHRIWSTTESVDYWPATNTTFWIEWRLWGMHPAGYHVTNLILHMAESLLIWLILRKLSIPGAFLAALIFAVHPVNVESVAWIAQRKDLTAMLFFLLSILWYLKADMPTASVCMAPSPTVHCPLPTVHWPIFYWLSLAAFVLAVLGKGSAVILPLLLLGIVWWLRPLETVPISEPTKMGLSPFIRRHLLRTAPFFAIAVVLTLVNVWFQTHGKEAVIRNAGFAERLLGAGGVVWFYLYKALVPLNLVFIYPQWKIDAGNPLWWLPLLAALAVTAVLWRYRTLWGRPLLFAWGFFCVALAPVLGFQDVGFMKYSLVADRYQHIAIIGVIALASAGFGLWRGSVPGKAFRAALFVAVAAATVLMVLTWRQSGFYRDGITLYQETLKKNPECWMAQNDLGIAMVRVGRFQEAINHFRRVLQINPDYIDAYINLGNALNQIGRSQEAIEQIQRVLSLKPDNPGAHYNMGKILLGLGRVQESIKHYQEAIRLKPDFPEAHESLANILFSEERVGEAIEHYQEAIRLKPNFCTAQNSLGYALTIAGEPQEAIEHIRQALRLKPDFPEAWYNLGNAYKAMGQYQQAVEHYRQALTLKPDYPEVHNNLGIALFQMDRPEEAIEHFKQVLLLRPEDINAYNNLASAYAGINQSSEAVAAAQKASELARAQGQPALAEQIEKWLNAYRAGLSTGPNTKPSNSTRPRP
jgi:tetratricopeptide (TPR) repeat protein